MTPPMTPQMTLAARLACDVPLLHEPVLWLWLARAARVMQGREREGGVDLREAPAPPPQDFPVDLGSDGVATVLIDAPLVAAPSLMERVFYGARDLLALPRVLEGLAVHPEVRGVLLHLRSPGGAFAGATEATAAVRRLSELKPVVAFSDTHCASLAYWLASQAREVVATRSASIGSIGVYSSVMDITRLLENAGIRVEYFVNKGGGLKTTGLPGTRLSDAQRRYLQERADHAFTVFRGEVMAGRPRVAPDAFTGALYYGPSALQSGLVDRLGEFWFARMLVRHLAH